MREERRSVELTGFGRLGTASMQMKGQIAVLAVAIGFLAVSTLGAVAMDSCPPCCPQPADAPCETAEAPCVALAAVPCCDVAPVVPASQAKRAIDGPAFLGLATSLRPSAPVPQHAHAPRVAGDLALRTSPFRLSVVLLI